MLHGMSAAPCECKRPVCAGGGWRIWDSWLPNASCGGPSSGQPPGQGCRPLYGLGLICHIGPEVFDELVHDSWDSWLTKAARSCALRPSLPNDDSMTWGLTVDVGAATRFSLCLCSPPHL
jgi:hypothetical protein